MLQLHTACYIAAFRRIAVLASVIYRVNMVNVPSILQRSVLTWSTTYLSYIVRVRWMVNAPCCNYGVYACGCESEILSSNPDLIFAARPRAVRACGCTAGICVVGYLRGAGVDGEQSAVRSMRVSEPSVSDHGRCCKV